MMESRLCFIIPQQLLSIWIMREKELLQEISGMGELGGEWRNVQMDLLDKHLKLLKEYSQAKQNLQHCSTTKMFKQSSCKNDESLEFAPVNLHIQRMWAYNDTLKRDGFLDIMTVGAFTRHSGKAKTGGLIKLLQLMRDSPSKFDQNSVKVRTANDAVQSIKQLRREIVEIMSQLLCLAKSKNPKGMLPLCNEMITKTKSLLNIWEPSLVEEAFSFIEKHRIVEDTTNTTAPLKLSPFRNIKQQLGALELKSPDLEDFATPTGTMAMTDLWSIPIDRHDTPAQSNIYTIGKNCEEKTRIEARNFKIYQDEKESRHRHSLGDKKQEYGKIDCDIQSKSTARGNEENNKENGLVFSETHFDVSGEIISQPIESQPHATNGGNDNGSQQIDESSIDFAEKQLHESKQEILYNSNEFDENGRVKRASMPLSNNGTFLDTKVWTHFWLFFSF